MQDSRTMMTTATSTTAVYNSSSNNEIVTMIIVQCYDIYPSIPRDLARLCPIPIPARLYCTYTLPKPIDRLGMYVFFTDQTPKPFLFRQSHCTVSIRNLGEFAKQFSQRMRGRGEVD